MPWSCCYSMLVFSWIKHSCHWRRLPNFGTSVCCSSCISSCCFSEYRLLLRCSAAMNDVLFVQSLATLLGVQRFLKHTASTTCQLASLPCTWSRLWKFSLSCWSPFVAPSMQLPFSRTKYAIATASTLLVAVNPQCVLLSILNCTTHLYHIPSWSSCEKQQMANTQLCTTNQTLMALLMTLHQTSQ